MNKIKIILFLGLFLSTLNAKELIYQDINSLIINSKYDEATDLLKFTIYKNGYITKEAKRLSDKLDKLKSLTQDIENDKLQVVTHINGVEYDPVSGERIYINKTFHKLKKWADRNPGKAGMLSAGLIVYSIGSLCKKYQCLATPKYSSEYGSSSNHNSYNNKCTLYSNFGGFFEFDKQVGYVQNNTIYSDKDGFFEFGKQLGTISDNVISGDYGGFFEFGERIAHVEAGKVYSYKGKLFEFAEQIGVIDGDTLYSNSGGFFESNKQIGKVNGNCSDTEKASLFLLYGIVHKSRK